MSLACTFDLRAAGASLACRSIRDAIPLLPILLVSLIRRVLLDVSRSSLLRQIALLIVRCRVLIVDTWR